jgi:SAM-dependent methyltransferase
VGAIRRALRLLEDRGIRAPLGQGVSVGGGIGSKERRALDAGLVETMDIYELSEARIEQGRAAAERAGLADRLRFFHRDAFQGERAARYDLVFWNNALHHMFDVDAAVGWSRSVLRDGGLFLMDDFVGPDRFQFSAASLAAASAVRAELPERYLLDPERRDTKQDVRVKNVNPAALAASDPSEAVQSGRILGAVAAHFPGVDILPMGGVVYNLALKDIVANFDDADPTDRAQLQSCLTSDAILTAQPAIETHYAIALALKGTEPDPIRWAAYRARLALQDRLPQRRDLQALVRRLVPSSSVRRWFGAARRRWRRS